MKKINKELRVFLLMFIFTVLVFYNFVSMHFATDTYNIANRGYVDYAITYS